MRRTAPLKTYKRKRLVREDESPAPSSAGNTTRKRARPSAGDVENEQLSVRNDDGPDNAGQDVAHEEAAQEGGGQVRPSDSSQVTNAGESEEDEPAVEASLSRLNKGKAKALDAGSDLDDFTPAPDGEGEDVVGWSPRDPWVIWYEKGRATPEAEAWVDHLQALRKVRFVSKGRAVPFDEDEGINPDTSFPVSGSAYRRRTSC